MYPKKFRSIDINKIRVEKEDLGIHESKIKELEKKLRISEDLISTFDTNALHHLGCYETRFKYFGTNSMNSLELSMINELDEFWYEEINHEKRPMPILQKNGNIRMIKSLVEDFFKDEFTYFTELFDRKKVIQFIDEYDSIKEWDHDEEMMVLVIILIDVLKDCLNKSILNNQILKLKELVTYYFQISKIQETETVALVKTQLVLLNYYYYGYQFSKAWKLLFQLVSNCYAIGIHINEYKLWIKVNFFESILCSVSSRPSIISNSLVIGESNEIEFIKLLRMKNLYNVEYKNDFNEILEIDRNFTQYIDKLNDNFLVLMTIPFQLNLHYPTFETKIYSDNKMMENFNLYFRSIDKFIKLNELNKIRDKFAALECLMFQSLLIFIKYLNFKIMNNLNDKDMIQLIEIQEILIKINKMNPNYSNKRAKNALKIINSIKIQKIQNSNEYSNEEIKNLFDSINLDLLIKNISEFESEFCE